jgi:hypothetical protein
LVEQTLDNAVKHMFVALKMAGAEWDINNQLRLALEGQDLTKAETFIKKYDQTFELATNSKIQIDNKYKTLYKLINQ